MTAIVSGPAVSMTKRLSNASRGHGVGSSGAVSANRLSVDTAIGSPVIADAAATRSNSTGSLCGRASRASTISPAYSMTPSSSGRRGRRRIADIPRRGSALRGGPQPGIDAVADRASHVGQHPRQVESVADVQRSADLVGELGQHLVVPAAGNPVEFGANVEQGQMGAGQRTQRVVRLLLRPGGR